VHTATPSSHGEWRDANLLARKKVTNKRRRIKTSANLSFTLNSEAIFLKQGEKKHPLFTSQAAM